MKRNTFLKWSVVVYVFILLSCSSDDSPDIINTGPTITVSDFTLNIDENTESGLTLGQIDASISSGTLTYIIGNQHPNLSMNIDANTGILTVRDSILFNFEKYPILTAKVYAINGDKQESADITITLNDVYEKYSYIGHVQLHSQQQVNSFGAENHWGVSGLLLIGNNQGDITDLSPLSSLVNIGTLQIQDLSITSLDGLNNIIDIEYSLRIHNNNNLQTLEELSDNLTIGKDLEIYYNLNLINLNGLSSLNIIPGNLHIKYNQNLNNITSLSSITEVVEDIDLHQNVGLTSFAGIENITQVGGSVYIRNNSYLFDINALSGMQTISGDLKIEYNAQLSDFCGIENLISNNGLNGLYTAEFNEYNPSLQDILDGNCSN